MQMGGRTTKAIAAPNEIIDKDHQWWGASTSTRAPEVRGSFQPWQSRPDDATQEVKPKNKTATERTGSLHGIIIW